MRTVKAIGIGMGITAIVSLLGCGSAVVESIVNPTIKSVLPQSIMAGTRAATVEVSGTNFTPSAVILWNGAQLSTSQVDSGTLAASVEGSSIAVPGTAQVQVRDVTTGRSSQAVPVSIVSATANATLPLAISSTSLSAGVEGSSYNAALAATGGTSPYTWSVVAGSLPAGLHLAAASGVISGVPTLSGTFAFTVSVSDSSSPVQTQTAAVSIAVTVAPVSDPPLAITSASLPAGTSGTAYTQTLSASGGTSPYTWTVSSGSLPAGLTLSSGGVISGTPTASGTSSFTISVHDSGSPEQTKTATLSMTVAPSALAITSTTLAAGTSGTAYTQTLVASGGTSPYTWTVSSGSLPAGLTLSSGGVISGTPTASGTSSFTVSVHDSGSPEQTKTATLTIKVAPPALTITSTTLVTGTTNTSYTATLTASGGTAPYTWKVSSGSLPAGLTLAASSGVVSGTPTGDGASSFTVTVTDSSNPAQTKSATISITIDPETASPGNTWFIRPDGGTRYSSNVPTGQCNGMYDQPYPGSGVNQNCAFNDVRYLWSDNAGDPNAWVISGGDTVVIRGCTALPSQMNPDNPHCRLGYDNNNNGNPPNSWCGYGNPNISCFNPPIPAGTAKQPTRILGQCAYGTYTCTPINNNYPYGKTNETQLFGGFGLVQTFNLTSTSYVEIEGIELTTHNGKCTIGVGTPAYPAPCSNSIPYSDYAQNGFLTDNTTSNIIFQDVYIHGFDSAAFFGPIGGPITMTRVFAGFNALAGWMFDDGNATPDAPGSSITANYVTMIFNGCYEQYPITAKYPAQVCYDPNSMGFGDSWSGQGSGSGGQSSELSSFYCNHCVDDYNTKDGFIGPHISIPQLTIINSVAIGNMGSNWKWGGTDGIVNTTTFQNNLTVNNCSRMSQPMDGAPSTYNMYLSNFCRAGGNGLASAIPIGSTWNLQNNTFISADSIALYVACSGSDTNCPATINSTNNVFLGYQDPWGATDSGTPSVYYFSAGGNGDLAETGITLNVSHNIEYGMTSGSCTGESYPGTSTGVLCEDPLLVNEPAQPWPGGEADLDVFDPFAANNSFYPLPNSQILGAGVAISGLTDDYYGVPYTNPPNMGAVASAGEALAP